MYKNMEIGTEILLDNARDKNIDLIGHGASNGHICYPPVFWTYFSLPTPNFLLPFTSSMLVGCYPTLASLLVTIDRM